MPKHAPLAAAAAAVLVATVPQAPASAQDYACDALGDAGWSTVKTVETVSRSESKPFRDGASGSWLVERTTTLLPFCNYYNAIGNYSLRSYTLSPEAKVEKVEICHGSADGRSVPVPPYAGACPPK